MSFLKTGILFEIYRPVLHILKDQVSMSPTGQTQGPPGCASSVKACCTSSWSAAEPSPSSGGQGCTPDSDCQRPPWKLHEVRTPRRYSAAFSALHGSSRNLR